MLVTQHPSATPPSDSTHPVDPSAREQAVAELRAQIVIFKRTLNLVRSSAMPDLGPSALPLLGTLSRLGPSRTTVLATELALDPSTISRQVDALARSGYVDKVADPRDRRASLVQLTESGCAVLREHLAILGAALHDLLADWSMTDLHALSDLLGRFNSDVHARIPHSPSGSAS